MPERPLPGEDFTITGLDRDTSRYSGPEGQVDFLEFLAITGRQPVLRGGRRVIALNAESLRWAGDRRGEPMAAEVRARLLDKLRQYYRARGIPFHLRYPSGELEDETGQRHGGFRTGLPCAEHSDGWGVTDFSFSSAAYPEPSDAPIVTYHDAGGEAQLTRRVEIVGGLKRWALFASTLHWIGARAGEPMAEAERARILERMGAVYAEWGYGYEIRR
jgi:hypothetical protein